MIRLSNTLKRLMKVGAILFGLAFIIAGVIGIRQDDTFLPTKAVIQSGVGAGLGGHDNVRRDLRDARGGRRGGNPFHKQGGIR